MAEQIVRRTPLFSCHQEAGGKMVDFAGWEMPIQYKGIVAEHNVVREHVGLFDVSHMGRVEVKGTGALDTIQSWIPNDASALDDNQSLYSPICNPAGGIVDDCLVYRLAPEHFLIVVNASNRDKDYNWFINNVPESSQGQVEITHPDAGDRWGLIAVQGPKARALLNRLSSADLQDVPKNHLVSSTLAGIDDCMLACTGYTGEDGFEIFVPSEQASALWNALMKEGEGDSIAPIGLGARDTLRMEMKYPLYGNDIDDNTSPIEAGLGWTVKLNKASFAGRDVIAQHREGKPPRRLVGFLMTARGIPRHGYAIFSPDGEKIGDVTSGGFSPSLKEPIGIGYVPAQPQYAKPGSVLHIEIRGKMIPAEVVRTPFYRSK